MPVRHRRVPRVSPVLAAGHGIEHPAPGPSGQRASLSHLLRRRRPPREIPCTGRRTAATMRRGGEGRPLVEERARMLPESPQSPIDPLIGRTRDLAAVEAALAGGRLVTITGLGGAGKTRLAREILRRALARGGAAGSSTSPTSPCRRRARRDRGGSRCRRLRRGRPRRRDRARDRSVRRHCSSSTTWSRWSARASSSPTSPGRLPRRGCSARAACGSTFGARSSSPSIPCSCRRPPEDLERSGASRLFLARARERGGLGSMTDEDRRAVVEICRRLDGLPLALELGAAWTRLLRPPAILRRLEAGRLTLAGRRHGRRHASLETVVDSTLGLVTADGSRRVREPWRPSPAGSTSRRRLRSARSLML